MNIKINRQKLHCIMLPLLFLFAIKSIGQLSIDPPSIAAKSKELLTLFNQKKYDVALTLVNKQISENPSDGLNYFNRAVIKYFKQDAVRYLGEEIFRDCEKAKNLGYQNAEIHYLLFAESYNCDVERSLKLGGIPAGCFFQTEPAGIYPNLIPALDSAIELSLNNEKYIWARIVLNSNNIGYSSFYEESIPTLQTDCKYLLNYSKNNRRRFYAYYFLAKVYEIEINDTLKAIEYYSAAMEIDPSYNAPYRARGKLRTSLGDWNGAISDYNIFLTRDKNVEIYHQRAYCYYRLDKLSFALKDINIAILLYDQKRKDILKGAGASVRYEFFKTDWGSAYTLRGLINFDLKNKAAALRDLNKAIEYGSKDALIYKTDLFEDSNQNQDNVKESESGSNSIPMIKKGGVYEIPITINNTLRINFIFDAGASDVSISADVALTLIRTGTVSDKDFIGTQTYKFADGSTAKSSVFTLKELQIGSRKVTNVRATISNSLDAPLLLGQSALNRFGKITIDYTNGVIHFED